MREKTTRDDDDDDDETREKTGDARRGVRRGDDVRVRVHGVGDGDDSERWCAR